jgi:hypothetical protein
MIPPLLTEKDVAALLKCAPHVVRRLPIARAYLKPNSRRCARYTEQAVLDYLASIGKHTPPPSDAAQLAKARAARGLPPLPVRRKRAAVATAPYIHWSEIPSPEEERRAAERRERQGVARKRRLPPMAPKPAADWDEIPAAPPTRGPRGDRGK